jgi:prepilin-type N-terminal cleavage/methylation domain-containing protein
MSSPRASSNKGFTLLELLITITITAMLLSLGSLFSFQYVRAQHLREDAQILSGELEQARAQSYAQQDTTGHGVMVFSDHVVRYTGTSYAARTSSKDATTAFPITATLSGASEVQFPEGGLVPSAAATVTLTSDTLAIDISVSAYGLVEVTERTVGG